jgi:hypothetical protein
VNTGVPPSTNPTADGHATPPPDSTRTTGNGTRGVTADTQYGTLNVFGFPVVTVTIDGKPSGDSPRSFRLKPGKHRIVLSNTGSNIHETHSVMIVDHKETGLSPGQH